MNVIRLLLPRVGAQAFLALASYLVSITAAHALATGALAAFFAAWALESTWVGAIRMVVVPALLLTSNTPRLFPLVLVNMVLGSPIAIAVYVVAVSALPPSTALLLALSTWILGGYELGRSLLAREHRSTFSIAIADGALFAVALAGTLAAAAMGGASIDAALLSLEVAAIVITAVIAIVLVRHDPSPRAPLLEWARNSAQILRLGVLEWLVFFVTSVTSIALLGALGGAAILSGVRLGETIAAPIGLLSSALPFIAAGALREEATGEKRWPRSLTWTLLLLAVVTAVWLAAVQLAPASALSLLVGDHVELARGASLGLAIGVFASLYSDTAALVLKKRGRIALLSKLRIVQLVAFAPCVALGALSGSTTGAGLGVSAQQSLPAVVLAVASRRTRDLDR